MLSRSAFIPSSKNSASASKKLFRFSNVSFNFVSLKLHDLKLRKTGSVCFGLINTKVIVKEAAQKLRTILHKLVRLGSSPSTSIWPENGERQTVRNNVFLTHQTTVYFQELTTLKYHLHSSEKAGENMKSLWKRKLTHILHCNHFCFIYKEGT